MASSTAPHHARLEAAKAAAHRTGIPYSSLRDLAHRGEIPIVRVGRAWYFERADVDRWIETQKERA
jgi:excisionase family DNA binding protein